MHISYRFSAAGLLLLFALISFSVYGQAVEKVNLEGFRPSDGLSSGVVTCVTQDAKGFMWFGTINGLNKYDGYRFTTYHHDSNDTNSLGNDYVTSLFTDSRKRIWVGIAKEGLNLLDPAHNRFLHSRKKLNHDLIKHITEDDEGNILFADSYGLYKVTAAKDSIIVHELKIINPDSAFYRDNRAKGLYTDNGKHFFLCCNDRVYCIEKVQGDTYRIIAAYAFPYWLHQEYGAFINDTVRHRLLLQGAHYILSFKDYHLTGADTLADEVIEKNSWSMDPQGNVWYYGAGGLQRTTPGKKHTLIQAAEPLMAFFISADPAMYWDRNGNLWLGTLGYGIGKYAPAGGFFHTLLPGASIHDISPDGNNGFMTKGQRFTVGRDSTASQPFTLDVRVIGTADKDHLWTIGINNINRIRNDGTIEQSYLIDTSGMRANYIMKSFTDHEGKIWMAFNYIPFLGCFDTNTHRFTKYPFTPQRTLFDYGMFTDVLDDPAGVIWFASLEGLFAFGKKTGQWRHFDFSNFHEPLQVQVSAICNDPDYPEQYIWVGTTRNGLIRMNKQTGACECFTYPRYIPDNNVCGLLCDNKGKLWLSTLKGLTMFDRKLHTAVTYDRSDGLQDDEFNHDASAKTGNGILVFGGLFGLNYFDPADLKTQNPPDVVLTMLRLFNKPVTAGDSSHVLTKDISYTDRISLRYRQNVITMEFAGLDFTKRTGLYYRYKLQGFDDNWQYAGKDNTATYTNLDPGVYHFYAQCSYSGSDWSNGAALLTISVIPPWWQTWWFYLLLIISVTTLVYTIYRYRVRQLLKVERLRISIAQDLHDEIGSTLSTLSIYAKVAQQQVKDGDVRGGSSLLNKINENAVQVMNSVSDIVWSINTRFDDFVSITNRMREYAVNLFDARGCHIHFSFDEDLAMLTLSMTKRKDFYLIFKEALNNAAKYADCSNLWISITQAEGKIQLMIRDDGVGFDTGHTRSGNGLFNMKTRAAQLKGTLTVDSFPGKGTVITLKF